MAFRFAELRRVVSAGLLIASNGIAAQGVEATGSESVLREIGLRVDRSMLVGPMADEVVAIRPDQPRTEVARTELSLVGSTVMLEMGRVTADGKFVRPRLTIGRQSQQLMNWMASIGIRAQRCLLPTFRGRLRRDQETGEVGVAVWISARCTFY